MVLLSKTHQKVINNLVMIKLIISIKALDYELKGQTDEKLNFDGSYEILATSLEFRNISYY